jgi:hypothetical protein
MEVNVEKGENEEISSFFQAVATLSVSLRIVEISVFI